MFKLTSVLVAALWGASLLPAQNPMDYFSSSQLKQLSSKLAAKSKKGGGGFASETLTKYGNHLTMVAHREVSGSSELHQKDADIFFIVEGGCTLITGGKMVNGKITEPNEERGTSIDGGNKQMLGVGDVVHIEPNTPHQMILAPGHVITYFVVKVHQ